jgi:oxygen-independent coproporphyrinogen-3 oxidase
MTRAELLEKYDVPIPRYTSYPTVPQWHSPPSPLEWTQSMERAANVSDASLAVYVHLPFCESLCSFCGCNNVITRDHTREAPYIDAVMAELDVYRRSVPVLAGQPLQQLHLGGGTPTFLSPASLGRLIDGILDRLPCRGAEFDASIEVDPRVTTDAHLEALRAHGFTRISLGVQDVDPTVQHLVNRVQPAEQTAALTRAARLGGFTSINFDVIYGLPGQSVASMSRLADEILRQGPDRLAVYGFAKVPWIKPQQRRFRDDQIPAGDEKRGLYEAIRAPLLSAGYVELGLDHFALPDDALAVAAARGRLHRNFMGYTEVKTTTLLGLGVSAISATPDCYSQNEKLVTAYEKRAAAGEIPTLRGHQLSADDRSRRERITDVMTRFCVDLDASEALHDVEALEGLIEDGLVRLDGSRLIVTDTGRPFLRNIASLFDAYPSPAVDGRRVYSTSL